VLGCIYLLESNYHTLFVERKDSLPSKAAQARQDIDRLNTELKDLSTGLEKIKEEIEPSASRAVENSLDQIQLVIEAIGTTYKAIEEFASQQTVLRGLATVGIAAAVFGHETQTSLSSTRQSISLAIENLTGRKIYVEQAVDELNKARVHAERTSQWGRFALLRIKNDKRKKSRVRVSSIIEALLKDIGPAYKASGIQIERQVDDLEALTFPMDIESIAINLLTNAYTACQQVSKNRKIRISVRNETRERRKGFSIEVADSGPGIPKEHLARVWEPLFTTKVDDSGKQAGTGLGLTIVESIVSDLNGAKSATRDSALGGAQFKIWLPA
jgi:signal transduction histidine kinase